MSVGQQVIHHDDYGFKTSHRHGTKNLCSTLNRSNTPLYGSSWHFGTRFLSLSLFVSRLSSRFIGYRHGSVRRRHTRTVVFTNRLSDVMRTSLWVYYLVTLALASDFFFSRTNHPISPHFDSFSPVGSGCSPVAAILFSSSLLWQMHH